MDVIVSDRVPVGETYVLSGRTLLMHWVTLAMLTYEPDPDETPAEGARRIVRETLEHHGETL